MRRKDAKRSLHKRRDALRQMLRDPRIIPFAETRNQPEATIHAMDILLKWIEAGFAEDD